MSVKDNSKVRRPMGKVQRSIYTALGFGFVALACLGVLLPLLPTTPFLLLGAACFARSSERWHRWLLDSRLFGPMLQRWHAQRCITRTTRRVAIGSVLVFGGSSVLFGVSALWMKLLGVALLAMGFWCVSRLNICQEGD